MTDTVFICMGLLAFPCFYRSAPFYIQSLGKLVHKGTGA